AKGSKKDKIADAAQEQKEIDDDEVIILPSEKVNEHGEDPAKKMNELMEENLRRIEDERKKTLFVKGFDRSFDLDQLKKLHPLIIRLFSHRPKCALLVFASEVHANKAYPEISKKLSVGYCGQKMEVQKTLVQFKSDGLPIDPTLLCVRVISKDVTPEELKTIFKTAKSIEIPPTHKRKFGNATSHALV
ncbi:hypothetical protein PMAYCL1PPCAC_14595, partial [Pristionchus mayeri]